MLVHVRRCCLLVKIPTILFCGFNVIFIIFPTVIGIPLPVVPTIFSDNVNVLELVERMKKSVNPVAAKTVTPSSDNAAERLRAMSLFSKNECNDLKFSKKSDSTNRSENLTWTESLTKIKHLVLNPTRYNKFEPPGQAKGVTTLVKVAFYIESMSTVRAQSMDFEVDTYLPISWYDHRLAHNCTHPILITDLSFSQEIWQPDLYFVNSKLGFIHQVTTPNFMILIYNDGFVFKSLRINVLLSCLMKLQNYPMDQQSCNVFIQSFAYSNSVMKLEWHQNKEKGFPIGYNPKLKRGMSDMLLIDEKDNFGTCDNEYPLFRGWGNWSCLRATLTMKRKLRFHLMQMFLPTAMLVCISWLSFWLDIRASPARISLTITTLLTLTTMSNGSRQELPQVSYMKSIDKWVSACQAFVFAVLLEFTIVSFFAGFKSTRFPLGFAIFNIGYWWFYFNHWEFYLTAELDDNEL